MKRRPRHAWPHDIVEVRATRPDPRTADPQATQKISREQLDLALQQTRSGTRRAVRSEPSIAERPANRESFPGPRDDSDSSDDSPQVTIVSIDSMELEPVGPLSSRPGPPQPPPPIVTSRPVVARPPVVTRPLHARDDAAPRLLLTPRAAFLVGLGVTALVLLAMLVGFFAGRGFHGTK